MEGNWKGFGRIGEAGGGDSGDGGTIVASFGVSFLVNNPSNRFGIVTTGTVVCGASNCALVSGWALVELGGDVGAGTMAGIGLCSAKRCCSNCCRRSYTTGLMSLGRTRLSRSLFESCRPDVEVAWIM